MGTADRGGESPSACIFAKWLVSPTPPGCGRSTRSSRSATTEACELARQRAKDLGRKVELRLGDAEALDCPDESFDTVVFGLCLCSIPDDRRAVAEAWRVLRRGGRILLLEHVRSPSSVVRFGQRLAEPLLLRFQADHPLREALEHLKAQGFEVERVDRWAWGIMERASAQKPPGK